MRMTDAILLVNPAFRLVRECWGCRPEGDGVHQAMLGIARLHNLLQVA
jgi:hypothetical protein